MPGGKYDSSKTRVAPVFDRLAARSDDWVRQLLQLAEFGSPDADVPTDLDLSFLGGEWGKPEHALKPPASLLEWLVQHPETWATAPDKVERRRLLERDPETLHLALESLRAPHSDRDWFILEGCTYPDAYIRTPGAIIVVEGKRTERGPTTHTKWMSHRHQIWRHIEGAWEERQHERVFGMFIVEGDSTAVPKDWKHAARDSLSDAALAGSFPHRSSEEVAQLSRCFLGVCTWRRVCEFFEVDMNEIPNTTSGPGT